MPDRPQPLGHVRWEGFSHRHLWHMIMDAQPNDVFGRYERWRTIRKEFAELNEDVQGTLNTLFLGWQGTAAMQAAAANTRLLEWAQEATEAADHIGEQLGIYGNLLVQARRTMPQPRATELERDYRDGGGVAAIDDPVDAYQLYQMTTDHLASANERAAAKQGAIDVMRNFEHEAIVVREEVVQREFTRPPETARPEVGETVYPPPQPPPARPVPPLPPRPLPQPHPLPPPVWHDEDGPTDIGTAGSTPGTGGSGPTGGGGGWYGPGGVGSLNGQGGSPHGTGGPGGVGGPAGFGGPAGAGGPLVRGLTGPGGVGGLGGLPAEAAAARGAAGAGAARGAGMGGMYPPMAGGAAPGDDDTEHRVAPYLVDADDLFDDDRTVAPPVFGA